MPEIVSLVAPNGRNIKLQTGLFINNEFVASSKGEKLVSIDPTTENEIVAVEAGSVEDIDRAVHAARAALEHKSWSELPGNKRTAMLNKLADLIEEHKETLATLETWDNGKPYTTAMSIDLAASVETFRYYAGWADKIHGLTIPTMSKKLVYTVRGPVGVCGQIIPWNYPILMASWKLAPALAAGNTVILKPAEQTPLSILYLAELIVQAGFPPGVVNIVNGYGNVVGAALAGHLGVDKIAFTGSTATGKQIQKAASANLKNVTLETGGKSPLLVFADADVEQAAKWSHIGIMSNQGQICTASSRLLVHEDVYDRFVATFADIVKKYKVGNPFDADTFQGPQVSKAQHERVLAYVQAAESEGATRVTGGVAVDGKGYFVAPTVYKDVLPNMRVFREEIFGPFVVISRFSTDEEAIQMANSTEYGLAASVFTQSIERAHHVAGKLQAGMVWINSTTDSDWRVPFGGVKQSGIGSELGEAGLEAYLQIKAVHVNLGRKL